VYYTVIKHEGHLRTRGKCTKHEPQASVSYISRVFSNVRGVLSQCNIRLRLLHLLYDIEVMWRKTIKHAFSMFYTLTKHGFLTNQSARRVLSIFSIKLKNPLHKILVDGRCTDIWISCADITNHKAIILLISYRLITSRKNRKPSITYPMLLNTLLKALQHKQHRLTTDHLYAISDSAFQC